MRMLTISIKQIKKTLRICGRINTGNSNTTQTSKSAGFEQSRRTPDGKRRRSRPILHRKGRVSPRRSGLKSGVAAERGGTTSPQVAVVGSTSIS